MSSGAPIIGNDNVVESGNGKNVGPNLKKMYESKHKNADAMLGAGVIMSYAMKQRSVRLSIVRTQAQYYKLEDKM